MFEKKGDTYCKKKMEQLCAIQWNFYKADTIGEKRVPALGCECFKEIPIYY